MNTVNLSQSNLNELSSAIEQSQLIINVIEDINLSEQRLIFHTGSIINLINGSFSNGVIELNYNLINSNFKIFKSNLTISSDSSIRNDEIFPDWFDTDDTTAIQSAINLAHSTYSHIHTSNSYKTVSIKIKCLSRDYNISNTIFVPVGVSIDGNGCCLMPSDNWEDGKYMFNLNLKQNGTCDIEYPGNILDSIGNFSCSNPKSKICFLIFSCDSRYVHDIYCFRIPKIYTQHCGYYLDGKRIDRICSYSENTKYQEYVENGYDNCPFSIKLGLGDATEVNGITETNIYITSGANATIRNAINCGFSIISSRNIRIENLHNEWNCEIVLTDSSLQIENAYLWAGTSDKTYEYAIKFNGNYNKGSELILNNVFVGNFVGRNINNYSIVKLDNIVNRISFNNVYALINNGGNGHNDGDCELLSYTTQKNKDTYKINPDGMIAVGESISTKISIRKPNFSISSLTWSTPSEAGTAYYIKCIYIVDIKRRLKLYGLDESEYYVNIENNSDKIDFGNIRCNLFNGLNTIQQISNLLVRFCIGNTSGQYVRYCDHSIIYPKKEFWMIKPTNDGGFQNMNNIVNNTPSLDYTYCKEYKSDGWNVDVTLINNILPTNYTEWHLNDTVRTSNGKIYTFNGDRFVDALGNNATN